jgi:hypothetical protein
LENKEAALNLPCEGPGVRTAKVDILAVAETPEGEDDVFGSPVWYVVGSENVESVELGGEVTLGDPSLQPIHRDRGLSYMDDAGELGHWRVVAAAGSRRPLARRPRRAPPIDGLGGVASPYGTLKQWVFCEHNGPLGGEVTVGVECDADMTGRGDVRHGGKYCGI